MGIMSRSLLPTTGQACVLQRIGGLIFDQSAQGTVLQWILKTSC